MVQMMVLTYAPRRERGLPTTLKSFKLFT
jgi:hypothetical protein